ADMVLIRAGRASLDKPGHVDRFTVHVVADLDSLLVGVGRAELIDGSPIAIETLRRIACDCGIVRHLMKGGSEPVDIGTRTSVWTTAQRRAIQVRDHGHCRWPGCHRRTCDCHHVVHHADGGPTAVHNGCLLCPQHHTCTHEGGFRVIGDANGTLTFLRPGGAILGRTAA
ncbi:MAG: nuclease, partial [Acidimicrobiales bacterium]|nr:nuclease [Acidimicrobiales bacterium]